jgi:hypothetical protein
MRGNDAPRARERRFLRLEHAEPVPFPTEGPSSFHVADEESRRSRLRDVAERTGGGKGGGHRACSQDVQQPFPETVAPSGSGSRRSFVAPARTSASDVQLLAHMEPEPPRVRFVIRKVEDGWALDRDGRPLQTFRTREQAIARAGDLIPRTPGAELDFQEGGVRRGRKPRPR